MKTGRAYHVESVIGRGGFGTIYRARLATDGSFQKVVALKVLHPEMARIEEVASRMRDEARLLGLVSHRAIVQCDGLVRLAGRWAIVMEYVDGADLLAILRGIPIPPGPALEIVAESAGALHQAWTSKGPDGTALGILHRDVKPSNIKLTAAGAVKLLDFGIARADFDAREARTGSLAFGSETYLSPERLDRIDSHAGDVYALGCVLYEVLTRKAWGRSSANEDRYHALLGERLALLRDSLGHVPPALLQLIEEMLAFEPDARPTARDVEWRCSQLQAQWPGERLRDWAEQVVPQAASWRKPLASDDLVGSTLWEQTEGGTLVGPTIGVRTGATDDEPEILTLHTEVSEVLGDGRVEIEAEDSVEDQPAKAPLRRPLPWKLMAGALGLVVVAAVGLVVVLDTTLKEQEVAPAVEDQSPTTAQQPEVPEAVRPVEENPSPVAPPEAKERAPVRTATTAPKPQTPPKESGAAPPPTGSMVQVSGDATQVTLQGAGQSFTLPGRVPAGSYVVLATFPGHEQAKAGELAVLEGGTVTLVCKSGFRRCQMR